MFDAKAAFFFVLICDVLVVLTQGGIDAMTEGTGPKYYDFDSAMMADFNDGGEGEYSLQDFDGSDLPDSSGGIMESIGQFFTDVFNTVRSWIMSIPGAKYVVAVVNAVPSLIGSIGFPALIAYSLGFLWHAGTVMLFILWIKG